MLEIERTKLITDLTTRKAEHREDDIELQASEARAELFMLCPQATRRFLIHRFKDSSLKGSESIHSQRPESAK